MHVLIKFVYLVAYIDWGVVGLVADLYWDKNKAWPRKPLKCVKQENSLGPMPIGLKMSWMVKTVRSDLISVHMDIKANSHVY